MQIYQLLFPNGKKYIGITSRTAQERFNQHCRSVKKYAIDGAIRKYGKENVIITVLATIDNWELLCLAEQEAIVKFNTKSPNGYNLTDGGEGTLGFLATDEQRKKLSLSRKGRILSEETKRKISIANKDRVISMETREKMKLAMKGYKPSPETRKIWSEQRKGRIATKETREKMSLARKGKPVSEEWRRKLSESNKGKKRSVDVCLAMSQQRIGFKHSKESIEKMQLRADMLKGIPRTQEVKNKISIANIGKKRSDEHKKQQSERMTGFKHSEESKIKVSENSTVKRKVLVDGIIYDSITYAGKCLGITYCTARNRALSSNFKNYSFV
jgi:group I intron endonuclease